VVGEAGADVILAILGPGDVLGEMSVVENIGRSADAMALEEVRLVWIDRASFWSCLQSMPTLSLNLIRTLSTRLRLANAQIQSLSTLDVYGRVARQILAFAQAYGTPTGQGDIVIPIRLTQSDMAGLVGATRVRVNQAIVAYKQRNFISIDQHHHITVHNATALKQRCQ
jgi:CRP/FNR family cyclic AMP-dependent transcriptional regulator